MARSTGRVATTAAAGRTAAAAKVATITADATSFMAGALFRCRIGRWLALVRCHRSWIRFTLADSRPDISAVIRARDYTHFAARRRGSATDRRVTHSTGMGSERRRSGSRTSSNRIVAAQLHADMGGLVHVSAGDSVLSFGSAVRSGRRTRGRGQTLAAAPGGGANDVCVDRCCMGPRPSRYRRVRSVSHGVP